MDVTSLNCDVSSLGEGGDDESDQRNERERVSGDLGEGMIQSTTRIRMHGTGHDEFEEVDAPPTRSRVLG